MNGHTLTPAPHGGNVLRMDQDAHLQGLREVTTEIERVKQRREDMVLAAAEAGVPRKVIAVAIGMSEPSVYNMRLAAIARREKGESG